MMDITLENRDKVTALLREGVCPICGKTGYLNPLTHITKMHKIGEVELKDRLMMPHCYSFTSAQTKEKQKIIAKKNNTVEKLLSVRKSGEKHDATSKNKMSYLRQEAVKDPKVRARLQDISPIGAKRAAAVRSRRVVRIAPNGEQKEYNSITEAARANNTGISNIAQCLRGVSKTAVGYEWRYKPQKNG